MLWHLSFSHATNFAIIWLRHPYEGRLRLACWYLTSSPREADICPHLLGQSYQGRKPCKALGRAVSMQARACPDPQKVCCCVEGPAQKAPCSYSSDTCTQPPPLFCSRFIAWFLPVRAACLPPPSLKRSCLLVRLLAHGHSELKLQGLFLLHGKVISFLLGLCWTWWMDQACLGQSTLG